MDYKEFLTDLIESGRIKYTEETSDGTTTLKAVIKYDKDGIYTEYLVSRSFPESSDAEENYIKLVQQVRKALKFL